jgi:hypothetical protein
MEHGSLNYAPLLVIPAAALAWVLVLVPVALLIR